MHSGRRRTLKSIAALSGSILAANRLSGSPAEFLVEDAAASAPPRDLPPEEPRGTARERTSRLYDFSSHRAVSNLKLDETHVEDAFRDALGGQGDLVRIVGDVRQVNPLKHLQGAAIGKFTKDDPIEDSCVLYSSGAKDGEIVKSSWAGDKYTVDSRKNIRSRTNLSLGHPGGIQTIGDYVVVPAYRDQLAEVHVYHFNTSPALILVKAFVPIEKAYTAGITNTSDDSGEYYVLALGVSSSGRDFHFYLTQHNIPISSSSCEFHFHGTLSFTRNYSDSISLFADKAGNVYFLGLREDESGYEFADLYRLRISRSLQNGSDPVFAETQLAKLQVHAELDLSFRWGGSALIT